LFLAAALFPVIVELFTSQGCSSCPPADALLSELDQQSNVIVLSEHVDYWNNLGWRDPFSSAKFSERQQRYARRFQLRGVYTPQMVVNGRKEFVGSDRAQAISVIESLGQSRSAEVSLSRDGDTLHVTAALAPEQRTGEVWIAFARPEGSAQVPRGENAGRNLRHVAVVESLQQVGVARSGSPFRGQVHLPSDHRQRRVIAFVQEPGQGHILGAAKL
jgi:hypothetical protein